MTIIHPVMTFMSGFAAKVQMGHDMIETTGDYHHQFLEGVKVVVHCGDVKMTEFMMGS